MSKGREADASDLRITRRLRIISPSKLRLLLFRPIVAGFDPPGDARRNATLVGLTSLSERLDQEMRSRPGSWALHFDINRTAVIVGH